MQRFSAVAVFRLEEAAADFFLKQFQFFPEGIVLSCEFLETYGVGEVGRPCGFVQIETNADDAVADEVSVEGILDEDAADLALSDPDVVGPLDTGLYAVAEQVVP